MIKRKLVICFIDNWLPRNRTFEKVHDDKLIKSGILRRFIGKNADWTDERKLGDLLSTVLRSRYRNKLNVQWALAPSICLEAVRKSNYKPDVVVYDWEYGIGQINPVSLLIDLIKSTYAFFFIYSNQAQRIPISLYKNKLDEYAERFQLLPKGAAEDIFTSEEFIYQYIASAISKKPIIKIGRSEIRFNSSGWLESPTDILYLESIIGRERTIEKLRAAKGSVTEEKIENWLSEIKDDLFINKKNKILVTEVTPFHAEHFGKFDRIDYGSVFKKYGLKKLNELLERGVTRV